MRQCKQILFAIKRQENGGFPISRSMEKNGNDSPLIQFFTRMADKVLKERIVSFRISKDNAEVIDQMLSDEPIIGIKSVSQWFRKIGHDFLEGRMTYKNPDDMFVDNDVQEKP